MISVSVEVREGTALSRATVQAKSICEAVSITRERYPGRDVHVMFPIDSEDFFNEDPARTEAVPGRRATVRVAAAVLEDALG
jgi:hypothetical protein